MNCECVCLLRPEDQTAENYLRLAKFYDDYEGEIYPVAISVVKKPVRVFCDINAIDGWGWGKSDLLKPGNTVLFVQGKLHHMGNKYCLSQQYPALCLFLDPEDINAPIEEYFDDFFTFKEEGFDLEEYKAKVCLPENATPEDGALEMYLNMKNPIFDYVPRDFSFKGQRVALAGKFACGKHAQVAEYIKNHGGKVVSGVWSNATVLLVGDKTYFNYFDYGNRGANIENALLMKQNNEEILLIEESSIDINL